MKFSLFEHYALARRDQPDGLRPRHKLLLCMTLAWKSISVPSNSGFDTVFLRRASLYGVLHHPVAQFTDRGTLATDFAHSYRRDD